MTSTTPYQLQVVVDCRSPHELADWWADALGWQVEPQDEAFIRSMIDKGFATEEETTTHHGHLVWASGSAVNHPDGWGPRILFQEVPETKTVKNRVHLDLRVTGEPSQEELDRLTSLGATRLGGGSQGPHHWVVLADPEGNELCLPVPAG